MEENKNEIHVVEKRVYVMVADIYKNLGVQIHPIPVKMEPFKPIDDVIINFKLVDPSKQNKPVTKFDTPIELWVQYTDTEERIANERNEPLQLAYWNGDHWVRFKEYEHEFQLKPDPSGGGYGVARISKWTDPPIAWGT